jgi:hypothetical protein
MLVVAQRPAAAVLIGLASALLLTACGSKDRSAVLARYECSQIAAAMALANAAADEGDDLRGKAMIDVQVGRLHVPGLRPVSIAAPSGAPLSWGAMTAPQRDTWSAWRALDDPRVIEVARTGNLFGTDPVSSCARDPLPPAPSDGLSSRKLADDVSPFNSATLEQAADRILRGSRDGKLVDGLADALVGGSGQTSLGLLEESALAGPQTMAYDGDGNGYLGASAQYRDRGVRWSAPQLVVLLDAFSHHHATWLRFLTGLAEHQAREILASTKEAPDPKRFDHPVWGARIGAMDAILGEVLVLPGNGRLKSNIASFSDAVVLAVDGDSAAVGAELAKARPGHVTGLSLKLGYSTAIAAGFVRNGVIEPQQAFRGPRGLMQPAGDLGERAQFELSDWLRAPATGAVIEAAVSAAEPAFLDRSLGCCK